MEEQLVAGGPELLGYEAFEFEAVVRSDANAIGVNAVPIEEKLVLKVGARVMTVTNDNRDFRYVNGTPGTVEKIDPVTRTVTIRPDPKSGSPPSRSRSGPTSGTSWRGVPVPLVHASLPARERARRRAWRNCAGALCAPGD